MTVLLYLRSVLFFERESESGCQGFGAGGASTETTYFGPIQGLYAGEMCSSRTVFSWRKLFPASLSSKSRLVFLLCGKHFTSGASQKSLEGFYK